MAKRKVEKPGIPEWVLTYGDMMSLLLCFFILLAAFSELKKPDEFQKVIDAIKIAFGAEGGDSRIINDFDLQSYPWAEDRGIAARIEQQKSKSDTNDQSTVGIDQTTATLFNGRKWTIGKPLPFAASKTDLTDEGKEIIRELIAPRIRGSDKMFLILGHAWGADDRLEGMEFMELSYTRAMTVWRFLIDECEVDRNKLGVWVAGDAQPLDTAAQSSIGMTNRRVEVFMTDVAVSELRPDAAGTGRTR